MNYKAKMMFKKNKTNLIILFLLWVFIAIFFLPSLSYALVIAMAQGGFDFADLAEAFVETIVSPARAFSGLIEESGFGIYFQSLFITAIIFLIFFIMSIFKKDNSHEYRDIEHGSSDWSKNGEQYKILSDKKGIILAEDNYLPIDKRGNVNVLVVGRIWFW